MIDALTAQEATERLRVAAQRKAWYEANREKVAARQKAWYEANREKVAAQQKAYRAKKKREAETP